MRWEPYIKNADVSDEKWRLIEEWLELAKPPKILQAKCKQSLKKLSVLDIKRKIKMLRGE